MPLPASRDDRSTGSVDAVHPSRTTSAIENPFASFYEDRRKLSIEDGDDETADPSSSITRAYIVPESLLALARGEQAPQPARVATFRADAATDSANMFQFRSPRSLSPNAEWRSVQRIALQLAGWLRRTWRRSIQH